MIRYPEPLRQGGTIGVTTLSSGVDESLHELRLTFLSVDDRMGERSF